MVLMFLRSPPLFPLPQNPVSSYVCFSYVKEPFSYDFSHNPDDLVKDFYESGKLTERYGLRKYRLR